MQSEITAFAPHFHQSPCYFPASLDLDNMSQADLKRKAMLSSPWWLKEKTEKISLLVTIQISRNKTPDSTQGGHGLHLTMLKVLFFHLR